MESKCSVNVNMMDRNFDNFLYRRLSTELVNASGAGDLTEVTRLIEEYRVKAGYVDLLFKKLGILLFVLIGILILRISNMQLKNGTYSILSVNASL